MAKVRKSDEFEQFEIDLQQLKDFQACEFYYDQEHNTQRLGSISTVEAEKGRYQDSLRSTVFEFFHKRQGDHTMSFEELMDAWESRWFPKSMKAQDLMNAKQKVRRTNLKDFSNVALTALKSFHDRFADDKGIPVMIDEDVYFSSLDRPDILFKHRQHLLLLDAPKVYRSFHFIGDRNSPGRNRLMMEMAIMHQSFKNHHEADTAVTHAILNVGRDMGIDVHVGQPTSREIDAMYEWAARITEVESYTPCRGFSAYCHKCKFDKECQDWVPKKKTGVEDDDDT